MNGGLFTATVLYEKEFDIENDILFEIIGNEFLAAFNLTYSTDADTNSINPDILGRVFEKTINYITSKADSTGKKEQGAYYTPTEVTTYLCERTIKQHLFEKSIKRLEELGQAKQLLNLLTGYDDLLRVLPNDPLILEELHKIVLGIKVLDPACGSGHFLKDAGDILLRINHVFYSKLGQEENLYHLQKSIIINNLYGVDYDVNAVEIAKLRLWMALIDSANENEKLEALPNIEYNIRHGNSLVGFITMPSNGDSTKFTDYVELDIADKVALLKVNYPDRAEEITELSRTPSIGNMTKIKDILIDIYKNENLPELRNILKVLIDQILQVIQSRITEDYVAYVNAKTQGDEGKKKKSKKTADYRDRVLYLKPFQWLIEFNEILRNGGFDVVIENPPYEVLKPRDREFFESHQTGFKDLEKDQQNEAKEKLLKNIRIKKEYDRYKESFSTYQLLLKYLPEYKLQTNELNGQKWKKSDPNYYRFFIERSNHLLRPGGRLGMICPKGFIGELGSTALRKYVLTSYSEFEFREFNNRTEEELIFEDVDPNFRFVVFSYLKARSEDDLNISYCYCNKLEDIDRPYQSFETNPLSFFVELNSELCILQWIRSGMDFAILKKLSAFPKLKDANAGFKLRSARELDMTLDQDKFTDEKTEIPLWEGSLINHYSKVDNPNQYIDPSKWEPNESFYKKRLVIRTILPNSVRKFYSTVLPEKIGLGNSLVYFIPEQSYDEQCYSAALLNSILLEYRGKQLLSKMTLNQFVIDLLPIPRDLNNTFAKRILALSKDLIEDKVEDSKRQDVMDQIDALVFKLFGLNVHEASFVLDTFKLEQEQKSRILMHYKRLP